MATYDFHIVNWKIKNPLSHILAFVYPEQVKCFNSLGQLSLSAPRPEIRVYLRLIGSSNKPITPPSKMTFTKAAFFKFDENVYNHYRIYCQWTISPDWHNICLVCAIPMLCHWFCHSKRYRDSAHFLHALKLLQNATNINSCKRSLFLQELSKIFFTTFINTRTLPQSYTCINFVF